MASSEITSTKMFECVPKDRNRKEKNLKVFVRDRFNSCNVLECSSRSPVSETEESLQTPSPIETNSNPFYSPSQAETFSRNDITMGASSLVQIWESRSQQSSSWQSQSLIDSRTSSGGLSTSENSNSSSFIDSLIDEAKNNNDEELDSQSDRSYVSESCEKEKEARCFVPYVRIRGKQAFDYFSMKIMDEREEYLKWIAGLCTISKFPPRGFGRLQYMLNTRSFERCIAIRERHLLKSANRFSRSSPVPSDSQVKKVNEMGNKSADTHVLQETTKKSKEVMEESKPRDTQEATCKSTIAKKAILSENTSENGLRRLEVERKAIEEVESSEETNMTSLSIAEKVNLWDSKERTMGKSARRGIDVEEAIEISKARSKKEEVNIFEERKSAEIEEYRINPQEVTSVNSLDEKKEEENVFPVSRENVEEETISQKDEETLKAKKQEASETWCLLKSPVIGVDDEVTSVVSLHERKEEENVIRISRENGKEEMFSQDDDEETSKATKQEASETLSLLESPRFLNGWVENIFEGEEEYGDYNGETEYYDWVSKISRPRSYWDDLRKQRELEVMNEEDSKKDNIIHKLIEEKTVSSLLASDFREEIDKILTSHTQKRLEEESIHVEEEAICEEIETEKVNPEIVTVYDGFSQNSRKSTMITQCFEDHEDAATNSLYSKDHENTSFETQMICDLREEIKELQRELLELKSLVKSCVDFQKYMEIKSLSDE